MSTSVRMNQLPNRDYIGHAERDRDEYVATELFGLPPERRHLLMRVRLSLSKTNFARRGGIHRVLAEEGFDLSFPPLLMLDMPGGDMEIVGVQAVAVAGTGRDDEQDEDEVDGFGNGQAATSRVGGLSVVESITISDGGVALLTLPKSSASALHDALGRIVAGWETLEATSILTPANAAAESEESPKGFM